MKVLAISYGRNLFDVKNIERVRMEACANETEALHMIVFTHKADGYSDSCSEGRLTVYPTNSHNKICMLWDAYCIGRKILREEGVWVVTSQDPFETGVLCWILARTHRARFNVQEHGDVFSTRHWSQESHLNKVRFYIGKWVLRRADTVRVVSRRMVHTMESLGIARERILQLSVRTNVGDFSVTPSKESSVIKADSKKITILSMARFVPQKNIHFLLQVFSHVHEKYPETQLKLVGAGSCEDALRTYVKNNDLSSAVTFLPWSDNPAVLMKQAGIYALTSNYEGWGRVLIEAMQVGLPTVTTDVGCANEVLIDKEHGFVVPIGDSELYQQRLVQLVADATLRSEFGRQAQIDASALSESVSEYGKRWAAVLETTVQM